MPKFAFALALSTALSGCIAYTVVDTAVGVAGTAVETTVDVTGAVVSGAADLVVGDDEDQEDAED
ncbi:MAG: hypothetical protein AAF674_07165 [Pseudomonadota bacterium]